MRPAFNHNSPAQQTSVFPVSHSTQDRTGRRIMYVGTYCTLPYFHLDCWASGSSIPKSYPLLLPLPSACLGKCAVEPHLNVAFKDQVCTAKTPDWPL
ncbi:Cell cycle checkpoint protein RAD1 [Fusarium oxysporum f. sp. albedinis]|nr:Cell cycle checkpoint protein RAD1 [Fusarium oxysporum f. sp. albedinis]